MKKILIFISVVLLSQVNIFGQMQKQLQKQVQKQVTGAVQCQNYSLATKDCQCHRIMYLQTINGKANYTTKGASSSAMLLARQRECWHSLDSSYSGPGEYEKKLKQIPLDLIPGEESGKGNIQAQYLFNQESANRYRKQGNTEKAEEFLDKNVEILIANMINKGWAAKNIMKHLYAGNLTEEQKEAALQTLNANLPNVSRCKSDICKVPGTVGDVAELFANCGEDTCMLTALHVELFNSLVQSGAKSVATDQALKLLTDMLVKNVGDANGKSKRFGDKQANATVKIPVLKAILELGDEDYYLKTTKKVLDKKTMSYSDSDTEVMSFIIDSYSAMDKYNPLIEMAFDQTKNKVARVEANIALANSDYPEILTDEEKQKIANILHYSYADETTACPKFVNETKVGGVAVLAGLKSPTETDAMLKQRICDAYRKLNVTGERTDLPCYPCEGNLGADTSTLVGETLISFVLDDAADDLIFGALTFGVGTVATHVIKGPKYINKTRRLASKVKKAVRTGNKFTDKITSGVAVPKKARKAKKAKTFTLSTTPNGKTVATWADNTTDANTVKQAVTKPAAPKGNSNIEGKISDMTSRPDFGNQLDNADIPDPKTAKGQTGSNPVVDPNAMKQIPQSTGRPRNPTASNRPANTPITNTAKTVDNAADVSHGANAAGSIADRLPTEPIPTLTPKKTALDPKGIKLTDEFDETLAKASNTPVRYADRSLMPNTSSPLPKGTMADRADGLVYVEKHPNNPNKAVFYYADDYGNVKSVEKNMSDYDKMLSNMNDTDKAVLNKRGQLFSKEINAERHEREFDYVTNLQKRVNEIDQRVAYLNANPSKNTAQFKKEAAEVRRLLEEKKGLQQQVNIGIDDMVQNGMGSDNAVRGVINASAELPPAPKAPKPAGPVRYADRSLMPNTSSPLPKGTMADRADGLVYVEKHPSNPNKAVFYYADDFGNVKAVEKNMSDYDKMLSTMNDTDKAVLNKRGQMFSKEVDKIRHEREYDNVIALQKRVNEIDQRVAYLNANPSKNTAQFKKEAAEVGKLLEEKKGLQQQVNIGINDMVQNGMGNERTIRGVVSGFAEL